MSYSLNEVGSLCKRATRGAGLSWGLAEDAARGVRWLSGFGLPGPQLLADRLELLEDEAMENITPVALTGRWRGGAGRLCPLITGAALSDSATLLAAERTIAMIRIACPLLLVPFAADAALELETPVCVQWDQVQLTTDGFRLCVTGMQSHLAHAECQYLHCSIVGLLPDGCLTPVIRGEVDEKNWERLSVFASRTYAPATEESRRKGAGS